MLRRRFKSALEIMIWKKRTAHIRPMLNIHFFHGFCIGTILMTLLTYYMLRHYGNVHVVSFSKYALTDGKMELPRPCTGKRCTPAPEVSGIEDRNTQIKDSLPGGGAAARVSVLQNGNGHDRGKQDLPIPGRSDGDLHNSTIYTVRKPPRKPCIQRIHIFGDMTQMSYIPEMNSFRNVLEKGDKKRAFLSHVDCASLGYRCNVQMTIGTAMKMIPGKDAVIFNMVGSIWKGTSFLKTLDTTTPAPNQTWVFYSTESPHRIIKWNKNFDIARLKYHVFMSYRSDAEIHLPFGVFRPFESSEVRPAIAESFYNRKGLISWVATNCEEVFWPRMPFVKELQKLLPLDTYGACGNLTCLPRRSAQCNALFASYKFYLTIPNTECHEYITEKFWLIALQQGIIPVVYGTKKEDYEKVAPPNSYIHVADFESLKDLADYLLKVDKDEALFRSYHEWRKIGMVSTIFPPTLQKICEVLPHLHEREWGDFKYIADSPWYNGCRERPNDRTLNFDYNSLNLSSWTLWD